MKKIVLMVFVLLMLFGCSNNEAYKDDEIYQYAEEIAVDYILSEVGYDSNKEYKLEKKEGGEFHFTDIYQVIMDGDSILLIEFRYTPADIYDEYSYEYGDGYMVANVTDVNPRHYKKSECAYSVSLNSVLDNK